MARRWQQGTSGVSFQFHSQQKKKQESSFIPAPQVLKFTLTRSSWVKCPNSEPITGLGEGDAEMEICGVPAHLWGPKFPGVTLQVTGKPQGGCPLACGALWLLSLKKQNGCLERPYK